MELERYEPERPRSWLGVMAPAAELAKSIASTDFVPRALRNNPAAIAAAILYGDEVGIGPMQSLARIAVIEGRPTLAAETQRALVLAAGHDLWLEDLTATRCTWAGRRSGRDEVTRVTWTLDDARRAGIANKQNWRSYPRQMLSARASAELVRAIFADVIGGLAATEEVQDDEHQAHDDATPLAGATTARKRRAKRAPSTTQVGPAQLPDAPDDGTPALPGEDPDAGDTQPDRLPSSSGGGPESGEPEPERRKITDGQRRKLHALMRKCGLHDRTARSAYSSAVLGRNVPTSADLSTAEADLVLDQLERDAAQERVDGAPAPPDDERPPDDDEAPALELGGEA